MPPLDRIRNLPPEVKSAILRFSAVSDRRTCANLCLVSSSVRLIALPHITDAPPVHKNDLKNGDVKSKAGNEPKNIVYRPIQLPDPLPQHLHITATLASRYIIQLFHCTQSHPIPSIVLYRPLPAFIAYALFRSQAPDSLVYGALLILLRLKTRIPCIKGSVGHRLFISAFMIASKVGSDVAYSSKAWSVVAQHMFMPHELSQMEREMCTYVDWNLNIEPEWSSLRERIRRDFRGGMGPYPAYTLVWTPRATRAALPEEVVEDSGVGTLESASSDSDWNSKMAPPEYEVRDSDATMSLSAPFRCISPLASSARADGRIDGPFPQSAERSSQHASNAGSAPDGWCVSSHPSIAPMLGSLPYFVILPCVW